MLYHGKEFEVSFLVTFETGSSLSSCADSGSRSYLWLALNKYMVRKQWYLTFRIFELFVFFLPVCCSIAQSSSTDSKVNLRRRWAYSLCLDLLFATSVLFTCFASDLLPRRNKLEIWHIFLTFDGFFHLWNFPNWALARERWATYSRLMIVIFPFARRATSEFKWLKHGLIVFEPIDVHTFEV